MKVKQKIALTFFRVKLKLLSFFSLKLASKAAFKLLCTPYTRKRAYALPPVFKLGNKLSFYFQNYTIHGISWQSQNPNGKTILICHGFDSASYKFAHFIQPLLNEGFSVMAFDAPAHGLSTGKTINVLVYRNFILEICKKFGMPTGIMAHSFGGVAAALALEQLPPNIVKRLVLFAPATETTRSIADFCRILHIGTKLQSAIEKLILTIGGNPVSWYSVARVVQALETSIFWIHDRKDPITPYEDMAYLQDLNLPHISFYITEGLGHSVYNDKTVENRVIEFMKETLK